MHFTFLRNKYFENIYNEDCNREYKKRNMNTSK